MPVPGDSVRMSGVSRNLFRGGVLACLLLLGVALAVVALTGPVPQSEYRVTVGPGQADVPADARVTDYESLSSDAQSVFDRVRANGTVRVERIPADLSTMWVRRNGTYYHVTVMVGDPDTGGPAPLLIAIAGISLSVLALVLLARLLWRSRRQKG